MLELAGGLAVADEDGVDGRAPAVGGVTAAATGAGEVVGGEPLLEQVEHEQVRPRRAPPSGRLRREPGEPALARPLQVRRRGILARHATGLFHADGANRTLASILYIRANRSSTQGN